MAGRLSDPQLAIIDCRFKLDDPGWGEREYATSHIPGAVYAHLGRDLAGPKTGTNGRHPLPAVEMLASTFGRWGITPGLQVAVYDQDTGMFASRLWWLLRWLGHESVAVLDGGFRKWLAEDRPVSSEAGVRTPGVFTPQMRRDSVVTVEQVFAAGASRAARDGKPRLLDARAPERYRGEVEPIDKAAGHIPGAANHHYLLNVDERGIFRSRDELRAQFAEALHGTAPRDVISYCGSGVSACHNLLAMEHAGLTGAKLYPGSWSEWSSDPARPIEQTSAAPLPPR